MIIFTQKILTIPEVNSLLTLSLIAEERTKTRRRSLTDDGREIYLQLPRGTSLQDGDILTTEDQSIVLQIIAKPEPVLTVKSSTQLVLMRAIYHLANRHVPLEITCEYLRLSPDPVLENLLKQMGLQVEHHDAPFFPESGAYHHH